MRWIRQRNRQDVTVTFATTGASFAATLVAGIVLSRVLGATGRGELAQLAVWSSFSVDVWMFGVPGSTTYSVARWPEHRYDFVAAVGRRLILQALGGIAMFSVLVVTGEGDHPLPLVAIAAYIAWIPLVMAIQWSSGYLQGRSDFYRFNVVRLLSDASPSTLLALLAAMGALSVSSGAVTYTLSVGLAGTLGLIWMRRDARASDRTSRLTHVGVSEVIAKGRSFARRDYLSTLAMKSNRSVDLLVVSLVPFAAADIGIYSVASSSSGAISLVGVSMGMVAFARAADSGRQPHELGSLLRISGLVTLLGAALLFIAAPTIVPLVYGAEFQRSVPLVRVLLFGTAALSVSQTLAGTLRGLGRPGSVAVAEAVGAATTLGGILLSGTSEIVNVAYSAVAGFAVTLLTEIGVLINTQFFSKTDVESF